MPDTSHVIDQPWQIELYRLNVLVSCLELERKTGMIRSSRGPATSTIARQTLTNAGKSDPGRSKVKLLAALRDLIHERKMEADIRREEA